MIEPQDGEIFRQPTATVRYLPQAPDTDGFATVRAYVEAGLGPADDPHRATYLLDHLGLTGDEDPATLSGGEARRAALARVLAPEPDILLLDEPTNHLDLPAIEWLEAELIDQKSALVLISHDRRFLGALSRATVWLDRGTTRRLDKGFAAFRGMARHGARRRRAGPAQARPPDRARGALAALRRDRAPQAQHAPARRIAGMRQRHRGHEARRGQRQRSRWPRAIPNPASW
jgi:ATP-binding cassette subfamily F protein uup